MSHLFLKQLMTHKINTEERTFQMLSDDLQAEILFKMYAKLNGGHHLFSLT
jgi:hypothetical protein